MIVISTEDELFVILPTGEELQGEKRGFWPMPFMVNRFIAHQKTYMARIIHICKESLNISQAELIHGGVVEVINEVVVGPNALPNLKPPRDNSLARIKTFVAHRRYRRCSKPGWKTVARRL